MTEEKSSDQYSKADAQRRFEAALRGAREVGHEPMKDIVGKGKHPATEGKSQVKKTAQAKPK